MILLLLAMLGISAHQAPNSQIMKSHQVGTAHPPVSQPSLTQNLRFVQLEVSVLQVQPPLESRAMQGTIVKKELLSVSILPAISVQPRLQDQAHIAIVFLALMEISADRARLASLMDLTVEWIISSVLEVILRELSVPTVRKPQMVRCAVLAQLDNSAKLVFQPLIASLATSQLEVSPHVLSAHLVKSLLAVQLLLMSLMAHGQLTVKRLNSPAPPAISVLQELSLDVKSVKLAPKVLLLLSQLPQVLSAMKSTSSMISLALLVTLVEP